VSADADQHAVSRLIAEHAQRLTNVDPDAPLDDLAALADLIGHAAVIGVARSTHGAHELSTLTHRVLRLLVEQGGFWSLAIEDDWVTGTRIDEFLRTGQGDPRRLLSALQPHFQTAELLDVLIWMRSHNERHPNHPVGFVGIDSSVLRVDAYDTLADHVHLTAPDRLSELEQHLAFLRPATSIAAHTAGYRDRPDKQPIIDHARQVHDLVAALPPADGRALALRNARAIVEYHRYHALAEMDSMAYLEARMAENLLWWARHTGHRLLYWSGSHSAVGIARTVSFPPSPPKTSRNAGSYLREQLGPDYVSVGLTFHHGSLTLGPTSRTVPAPPPHFAEAILGGAGDDAYLLDLHADMPETVRAWLDGPATVRLAPSFNPAADADTHMTGGSLTEWFDVIIHMNCVAPTRTPHWHQPLARRRK
jgi:erythromycin esterase